MVYLHMYFILHCKWHKQYYIWFKHFLTNKWGIKHMGLFVCSLQFLTSLLKPALTEFRKKYVAPIAPKNYFSFSKDIFNFIWSSFLILNCVQRYTFGYQEWFLFNTMSIWILDDLPSTLQNRGPRVTLLWSPHTCLYTVYYLYVWYIC